jgi:hypothetical protein
MGLKFQHFLFFYFVGDFFENFSILEVEIGRNGPRILGVKQLLPAILLLPTKLISHSEVQNTISTQTKATYQEGDG